MEPNGSGELYCYSNGVRELRTLTADGTSALFTEADGQTVCYRVDVVGTSQTFRRPDGEEVAVVTALGGSSFSVTCGGATVTVDIADPACRTLNSGDCIVGACP
jgi:hypothetical protein